MEAGWIRLTSPADQDWLSNSITCSDCHCWHPGHGPTQRSQRDSAIAVVDQRPFQRAVIAQPVVLNFALVLLCTYKRRRWGIPRFGQTVGLNQKQLAFSESEKRFRTLRIGASAQHSSLLTSNLSKFAQTNPWRATGFHTMSISHATQHRANIIDRMKSDAPCVFRSQ